MNRSTHNARLVALTLLLGGCAAEAPEEPVDKRQQNLCAPLPVDPARSLAVTDLDILARFPLQRVMNQIVASAAVVSTAQQAYHSIFDTQNPAPGFLAPPQQHCTGTRNGFPQDCPRQEGILADAAVSNPFCTGAGCDPYEPLGLFNRFDLAPAGGANCGEYRIVYGKRSAGAAPPGNNRNLIIFEAVLPNPKPGCGLNGLEGCKAVTEFWARLSTIPDPMVRAAQLEQFYFAGLPGFAPVVRWSHYSAGSGQIRTNQFMNAVGLQPWQLREHKLRRDCTTGPCLLLAESVTTQVNPAADLFNPASAHPQAAPFRADFLGRVPGLAALGSINDITMTAATPFPNAFNEAQSTASPGGDTDYIAAFGGGGGFATSIAGVIPPGPLNAHDIVRRAETQSCAGCHQLSNNVPLGGGLIWPPSLGFTHVSDTNVLACATSPGGCWEISPALRNEFLPRRQATLKAFVDATWCNLPCP